jgi:hypothetical protein
VAPAVGWNLRGIEGRQHGLRLPDGGEHLAAILEEPVIMIGRPLAPSLLVAGERVRAGFDLIAELEVEQGQRNMRRVFAVIDLGRDTAGFLLPPEGRERDGAMGLVVGKML